MSRRVRSRQIEIFNFSFLDILACTIGLLIFIMVMVFILQNASPMADPSKAVSEKNQKASMLEESVAMDTRISVKLESELEHLVIPSQTDLTPQRDSARALRDDARERYRQATSRLALAQAKLDEARMARTKQTKENREHADAELAAAHARHNQAMAEVAAAIAGGSTNAVGLSAMARPGAPVEQFDVLHVDCRDNQVRLFKVDARGKTQEVGWTNSDDLKYFASDFQNRVGEQRKLDSGLVVFWVRPGAVLTFEKAREALPSSTTYGYEPADADWEFVKPTR